MRNGSIAFSCFLAALAPSICLASAQLFLGGDSDSAASFFGILTISFLVAAIPTMLLGLPYILWLRSRNALTWLNICLGSSLVGTLTMAILVWVTRFTTPAANPSAYLWLWGAGLGLAGGVAFCLGARPSISFKLPSFRGAA
jgi:hypothetical protein